MAKRSTADPTLVLPRTLVQGVQSVDPSTGRGKDFPLTDSSAQVFNQSIAAVRSANTVFDALRLLRRISGDTSTAIASFIRLANTPLGFRVYDSAHQLNEEGASLLKSILGNFQNLNDYTYGFDDRQQLGELVDTLLGELLLTGGVGLELVLDKARLPFKLQPVSPKDLKWRISKTSTGKSSAKIVPWQQAQGVEVVLDVPTFFYAALDKDPTVVYPKPPIEASVNASVFHAEVVEDIRRVVRRSGHSRLVMKLITESLVKAAPLEVKMDAAKMQEWMEQVRTELSAQLEGLNPESALVLFDTVEADYLNSEIGASADYGPLMELVDGIESTALRTPPSVLGKRMGGSQNVSSTESLLFIKQASGLHRPLESVLSRALTLAVRLYGFDGYVETRFAPIDLRPDSELAAFRAMDQARILELLSLGFYTDQEAAELLGTGLRAPEAPPLSGTFFYKAAASVDPNTGMTAQTATRGDPAARALAGNAPQKAGGASK